MFGVKNNTYIQSTQFANGGQIQPEVGTFDGRQYYMNGAHVTGLKIWIRKFDNNPIVGGMQVFYSNGQNPIHGCSKTKEAIEFRLDRDEFITKVEVKAGWLIDNLAFHTTKGDVYGPYGGKGGGSTSDQPPGGRTGHLAGISGSIVQTQGAQAITRLCFTWACPPETVYQESSVYAVSSPNHKVFSAFDGRAMAVGGAWINGMKFWIRRSGKPVIAGVRLTFSNGNSVTYGGTNPKEINEFSLPADEKINQIQLFLGDVIEGMTLTSTKGRVFGPFGGTTGACVTERSSSGKGVLAFFSGNDVAAHGGHCLSGVKFSWMQ